MHELLDIVDEPPPNSIREIVFRDISPRALEKWQNLSIDRMDMYREDARAFMGASLDPSEIDKDEVLAYVGGGTNASLYLSVDERNHGNAYLCGERRIKLDMTHDTPSYRRALLGGFAVCIAMLET